MNFTLSQAKIKDPNYTFAPTFQSGSTNIRANALFNTSSNLADTFQGYDSIQNSDALDKYIGFRGNFKNITNRWRINSAIWIRILDQYLRPSLGENIYQYQYSKHKP